MIRIVLNTRLSLKIMIAVLDVLCFLVPAAALATTQFSDNPGPETFLDSLPLEPYYGPGNPRPKFRAPNTATWRLTSPPGRSTRASST